MSSSYAEINSENIVIRVVIAEKDFIDSGALGDPNNWIQSTDGDNTILRKNRAAKGMTYNKDKDVFIESKPFPSFVLNEETYKYEHPVAPPDDDKRYIWDEDVVNWVEYDYDQPLPSCWNKNYS